ncbi:hypothetical protein BU24DRAFT_157744 [Aaosphaeria arxii CBS 175.79]|uniref:Uncharacterized protein n=1 Tax=Aaosphaeria arxii CBS 175.79 TaxID=1450172 RepID=A0A6A5XYG8_9PLEO|nr:uncharacterized protein BU24DRAFT_157744 [Aaosphaeria arxii CBS 175.79]KAF2017751.1 hypothetical protein BU24DRAFT_157744 [Aaosphaeria arxii CBS 175.79]
MRWSSTARSFLSCRLTASKGPPFPTSEPPLSCTRTHLLFNLFSILHSHPILNHFGSYFEPPIAPSLIVRIQTWHHLPSPVTPQATMTASSSTLTPFRPTASVPSISRSSRPMATTRSPLCTPRRGGLF